MADASAPRVRFAPSPTGYLHIGGARTALFNWLYARRHGGVFVLRIEDTDQERSTAESMRTILESLEWLGLDWDEGPGVGGPYGPYTQMERLALYREYAERLIAEGKAYRCYATKEELDVLRKEAEKRKEQFFYPHIWRDKTEADWPKDKPHVVRFKTPLSGETAFDDKVFGTITTPNTSIQDFVLLRSDGVPLYNFGAVVDDVTMKITLVARGRDHIINTPPQVLLYRALGYPVPRLAHLPMILAPDGKKLSKREAERYDIPVSVGAYRDRGFSPDGLLNYLVRFGWSHGDQETFSRKELIELFDFATASRADGKFDMKKCLAINHKQIKETALTPTAEYLARVKPFLALRGVEAKDDAFMERAIATVRERARTYVEAADALDYYLRAEPVFDDKAKTKFLVPDAAAHLRALHDVIAKAEPFTQAAVEEKVNAWLAEKGLQIKDVAQAARVALTGRSASPGLFEVIEALGRETALRRLEEAARIAESSVPPASLAKCSSPAFRTARTSFRSWARIRRPRPCTRCWGTRSSRWACRCRCSSRWRRSSTGSSAAPGTSSIARRRRSGARCWRRGSSISDRWWPSSSRP
jgi:glutamyl-tRNA synthetase